MTDIGVEVGVGSVGILLYGLSSIINVPSPAYSVYTGGYKGPINYPPKVIYGILCK